jgi:predicted DNA-binding protein
MSQQAAPPAEVRGYVTITLPVQTIQRLQPLSSRRARSRFIEQAIEAALDKADQDEREPAAG